MKAKLLPHAVPVGQSLDLCNKILITRLLRGLPQKKLNYSVVARGLFIQQKCESRRLDGIALTIGPLVCKSW